MAIDVAKGLYKYLPGILVIIFIAATSSAQMPEDSAWVYKVEELRNVSLTWSPSVSITGLDPINTTVFRNKKIIVKPFTDSRRNPQEIGRNIEKRKSDKELIVTTKDNVALWLTERFNQVLSEFDVAMVKNEGTVILESDILKFYVTESAIYKANVALNMKLLTTEGSVLWEGMVIGAASNWGASYKENNYHESLSNACIDLVYNFLKNEQISQAMKTMK
jgi:hypothetical protein